MQRSYYDVLGVSSNSSIEDIRIAYHAAILQSHPDKQGTCDQGHFILVQQAWEVLRDLGSRSLYDACLKLTVERCSRGRILEELSQDEVDSDGFSCRCGGKAIPDTSAALPQIIECDSCSLRYRLVPNNAEK
jgi:diphthamide biosynthesis protein 4